MGYLGVVFGGTPEGVYLGCAPDIGGYRGCDTYISEGVHTRYRGMHHPICGIGYPISGVGVYLGVSWGYPEIPPKIGVFGGTQNWPWGLE
jgi:hypothetical protein